MGKYLHHPIHMIPYPHINPVCVSIFGFAIYWYSLAYIGGLILGLWQAGFYIQNYKLDLPAKLFDQLSTYLILGIIIGGRVGFVFLYAFDEFIANPWYLVELPIRGMSFHGGFLGVILAVLIYTKLKKISPLKVGDVMACAAPIGLFFGRIANFINGELYGRITDAWYGMIFPCGGIYPRHPSQLYEAFLEGIILWLITNTAFSFKRIREIPGMTIGLFALFYGVFRFLVEYVRDPSGYVVFRETWLTLGQIYSLPVILFGFTLLLWGMVFKKK